MRNIYDNSVHLDMSLLKGKSIDLINKTVTVQSGNTWGEILEYVGNQSNKTLLVLTGADKGVGPYGWVTGGGHGFFTRTYGLGADVLLSVDFIIANGTTVTANMTQNKELFRAFRGSGGPAFGIGSSLTFKLFDVPNKVTRFSGIYELNDALAETFGNFMINAPNNVAAYYIPSNIDGVAPGALISALCHGDSTSCDTYLSKLNVNCIKLDDSYCKTQIYNSFYLYLDGVGNDKGNSSIYISGNSFNKENIVQGLKDVNNFVLKNKNFVCSGNAVLGGISTTLDPNQEDTAISPEFRKALMSISCVSALANDKTVQATQDHIKVMDDFNENTYKKYGGFTYWNEPQHNFPNKDWKQRYWGSLTNYERLMKVKTQFDPNNFFTCYHCVGYDENNDVDPTVCPKTDCSCSNNSMGECVNFRTISPSTSTVPKTFIASSWIKLSFTLLIIFIFI